MTAAATSVALELQGPMAKKRKKAASSIYSHEVALVRFRISPGSLKGALTRWSFLFDTYLFRRHAAFLQTVAVNNGQIGLIHRRCKTRVLLQMLDAFEDKLMCSVFSAHVRLGDPGELRCRYPYALMVAQSPKGRAVRVIQPGISVAAGGTKFS